MTEQIEDLANYGDPSPNMEVSQKQLHGIVSGLQTISWHDGIDYIVTPLADLDPASYSSANVRSTARRGEAKHGRSSCRELLR